MTAVAAALIGYLMGSLPLGFLVTRSSGRVDLRRVGSGNVGAANAYRTAGPRVAALVLLVDVGKGAGSVLLSRALLPASGPVTDALAGLAGIVGHIYPVWLRFAGGKGVAAACGVFAVLAPMATVWAAAVFAATTLVTRYVSLGSILATLTLPVVQWLGPGGLPVDAAASGAAALILFRHRGNLARLARGTERRIGAPVGS
jgi:glycerol-3-phosphate acyltransferase PlsY